MVLTLSTLGQSNYIRGQFVTLEGEIQKLENQVGTGENTQVFGDLGNQASLDISLRQQADMLDNFKQNISQIQVRTSMLDQTLSIIHDTALSVQNEAFQQPSFPPQRQNLVSAAQAAIDQITQRLQTSINGRNLYGGTQTQGNPMINQATVLANVQTAITTALAGAPPSNPPAVQAAVAGVFTGPAAYYTGGPPYPPAQVDVGLSVNDSITAADPAFQSILQGLYTIAALPQPVGATAVPPNLSDSDFDTIVQQAASQISGGLSQLSTLTEKNGQNEKFLSDETDQHDATLTTLQMTINNIESVNVADATTRLTQLQAQLQASFHIVADLSNLNLLSILPVP